MKCKYCDKEAVWYNPITKAYYCAEHAVEKVKQLQGDLRDKDADTPKDWFIFAKNQLEFENRKK